MTDIEQLRKEVNELLERVTLLEVKLISPVVRTEYYSTGGDCPGAGAFTHANRSQQGASPYGY